MPPTSPPEPDATRPGRIGVYGGTFDPVHTGHMIIASRVRYALGLDRVLFVPAKAPPHKDPGQITPAAIRVEMLEAAIAGDPWFAIDTIELERPGRSYTVDTLTTLRAREPDVEPWFIMGADSLVDLPTWRDPAGIVRLARLAVVARPGSTIDIAAVAAAIPGLAGRVDVVEAPLIGIASRELRAMVRRGEPIDYLVPAGVAETIQTRRLYAPGV